MISDELYEVLKHWLADATSAEPSPEVKWTGLCSYWEMSVCSRSEMEAFWQEQELDTSFPFNSSPMEYFNESDYGLCHLNPRRLAWVRERIAEYDHTLAMYEEAKRT